MMALNETWRNNKKKITNQIKELIKEVPSDEITTQRVLWLTFEAPKVMRRTKEKKESSSSSSSSSRGKPWELSTLIVSHGMADFVADKKREYK